MTREEKNQLIDSLADKLASSNVVYLTDVSEMTVEKSNRLRRACFQKDITLEVVKNTLLKKAMDRVEDKDFSELYETLKGNTSIMLSEVSNAPAKLIKEFRKKEEKPILKAAFVEETVYVGDDQLESLTNLKSKNELIADVIALLQSPAKNVISGLSSGGGKLAGIVKTLSEREA
ncbi:MAG: 50S ribosomal protein L10 [Salibacteraceae bacterium]